MKDRAYARYHLKRVAYAYEVDHLVTLELGGPNALANLWPEHYHGAGVRARKEWLEYNLHALVALDHGSCQRSSSTGISLGSHAVQGEPLVSSEQHAAVRAMLRLWSEERAEQAREAFDRGVSFGEALAERVTRGIVFARLAKSSTGMARQQVADAVADMLHGAELPH